MFKRLFKLRYCRIFSKRFLGMTFWTVGTPIKLSLDQYILVSGKELILNKIFNAKKARISLQVVAYHLGSGFVWMHCSAWQLVSSTIFLNRYSGQRRRKKSKAVPSSGTREVGPVHSTNSSTWTGKSSVVQRWSISSSLSLSLLLPLSLSETEISDSSLICCRKALALSTSSVSKPQNSSPSELDAITIQGFGNFTILGLMVDYEKFYHGSPPWFLCQMKPNDISYWLKDKGGLFLIYITC